jgi:pimeloyl-ACP methyl ester carboxylesterase
VIAADRFHVGDREVPFLSAGSGAPLVLVHGSAGSARQWKRLLAHFAPSRHVFAYDLPGCGGTRPLAERPGIAGDVLTLLAAVDRLGQPVDVVAHSAGAVGVLRAALERPGAFRTLTLFEPVLFNLLRDSGDPAYAPVAAHATAYRRLFDDEGPAAAMGAFVDFWNGPGTWTEMPEPVRASMVSSARRLYHEWGGLLAGKGALSAADLTRVALPVLYFCGEETIAPVKRIADIAAALLPRCELVSVPGATHMAPFTHAGVVAPRIEAHLAAGG